MSLTGTVYCDCVEKNQLRIPHPLPELLFVDESGYPNIRSSDPHQEVLHDNWEAQNPCSHSGFRLAEYWLGNVASIGQIREKIDKLSQLTKTSSRILTAKVIYSGSHSGDYLTPSEVVELGDELASMQKMESSKDPQLNEFVRKLEDLINKAMSVGKPIAF
jgi:hypothetical protein